jgi:NitT/TauT family transport system substrate-binding protein
VSLRALRADNSAEARQPVSMDMNLAVGVGLTTRREVLRILGGASLVVLGEACRGAPSAPASTTAPRGTGAATVRAGARPGIADAGWLIAMDRGYFQDDGIDFQYTANGPVDGFSAIATGELDVAGGAVTAGLFNAIGRGVHVRVIADKGSDPPEHAAAFLLVRQDLWDSGAVRSPSDAKGRKIAFLGTPGATYTSVNHFLQSGGISLGDLEIVSMGWPDMLTALAAKSIDLALESEPFRTLAEANGVAHTWISSDRMLPGHVTAVVTCSPAMATDRSDVTQRVITAYLRGVRDYNTAFIKRDAATRSIVVDILSRETALNDATLYERIVTPGLDPNGQVPVASLEMDQEYFLSTGVQTQAIDLSQVVDMQFCDAAVSELGPY